MKKTGIWIILLVALLAFEIFNFSVTQYALLDMIGSLTFAGLRWASILACAFCGIDLAGIARLFTPEQGKQVPSMVWYLFGAWLLAVGLNSILTWWGVSVAMIAAGTYVASIPIIVSVVVFIVRVLTIGALAFGSIDTHAGNGMKGSNPTTEIYSVYRPQTIEKE